MSHHRIGCIAVQIHNILCYTSSHQMNEAGRWGNPTLMRYIAYNDHEFFHWQVLHAGSSQQDLKLSKPLSLASVPTSLPIFNMGIIIWSFKIGLHKLQQWCICLYFQHWKVLFKCCILFLSSFRLSLPLITISTAVGFTTRTENGIKTSEQSFCALSPRQLMSWENMLQI